MTKLARLVDFQVYVRPNGLARTKQQGLNESLFSTFEPVRLWLREREVKAPFRKIVVSLAEESSAQWHGHVSNVSGVCEITESIAVAELARGTGDHQWVLGIVQHALGCVARSTGWRSDELEGFIRETAQMPWPLVHLFERLARVDKASGLTCVPWLSTRPGQTTIGVRMGTQDVVVISKQEPIYIEDEFPVVKSAIRGGMYVLLDKAGGVLASVAIDPDLT